MICVEPARVALELLAVDGEAFATERREQSRQCSRGVCVDSGPVVGHLRRSGVVPPAGDHQPLGGQLCVPTQPVAHLHEHPLMVLVRGLVLAESDVTVGAIQVGFAELRTQFLAHGR